MDMNPVVKVWFWLLILSIIGFIIAIIFFETTGEVAPGVVSTPIWIWIVFAVCLILFIIAFILYIIDLGEYYHWLEIAEACGELPPPPCKKKVVCPPKCVEKRVITCTERKKPAPKCCTEIVEAPKCCPEAGTPRCCTKQVVEVVPAPTKCCTKEVVPPPKCCPEAGTPRCCTRQVVEVVPTPRCCPEAGTSRCCTRQVVEVLPVKEVPKCYAEVKVVPKVVAPKCPTEVKVVPKVVATKCPVETVQVVSSRVVQPTRTVVLQTEDVYSPVKLKPLAALSPMYSPTDMEVR